MIPSKQKYQNATNIQNRTGIYIKNIQPKYNINNNNILRNIFSPTFLENAWLCFQLYILRYASKSYIPKKSSAKLDIVKEFGHLVANQKGNQTSYNLKYKNIYCKYLLIGWSSQSQNKIDQCQIIYFYEFLILANISLYIN